MRTALLLALLAAIALPEAVVAGETEEKTPLIAVDRADGAKQLRLVDPLTLRPASRWIRGFRGAFTGAGSPDGRRLAVGSSFGRRAAIRVIDLSRRRSERVVELNRRGPVLVEWPLPDRIVAVAATPHARAEIAVVDPLRGRVLARHSFRGRLLWHDHTATGIALLLAPSRRLGHARLLVGEASGAVRTVALERIQAGGNEGRRRPVRYRQPGLAIDPTGRRAYVVAPRDRSLVATVDLGMGAVEYHEPAQAPVARAAKGNIDVNWREAASLGTDSLVVTGFRSRPMRRGSRFPPPEQPYGVRLIDTSDWSIRTLSRTATQVHVTGDRLLAFGTSWSPGWRRSRSTGLLAFDGEGHPVFTRFRGQEVMLAGSNGERAYVWVRPTQTLHVLDLRDGRSLHSRRTRGRDVPLLLSRR
jgi:hypothetical protein